MAANALPCTHLSVLALSSCCTTLTNICLTTLNLVFGELFMYLSHVRMDTLIQSLKKAEKATRSTRPYQSDMKNAHGSVNHCWPNLPCSQQLCAYSASTKKIHYSQHEHLDTLTQSEHTCSWAQHMADLSGYSSPYIQVCTLWYWAYPGFTLCNISAWVAANTTEITEQVCTYVHSNLQEKLSRLLNHVCVCRCHKSGKQTI